MESLSEWRNSDFGSKNSRPVQPQQKKHRFLGWRVGEESGQIPWCFGAKPLQVGQSKNHKVQTVGKFGSSLQRVFFRRRFRNLRSRPLCNGQGSGFRVSYPLGLRCKIIDRFWSMPDVTKMSCFFFSLAFVLAVRIAWNMVLTSMPLPV